VESLRKVVGVTALVSAGLASVGIGMSAAASAAAGPASSASWHVIGTFQGSAVTAVQDGTYHSWPAAQRAAGFGLLRPGESDGLKLNSRGITVGGCEGYSAARYATVIALYGADTPGSRQFTLFQADAPHAKMYPCSNIGEATSLGSYKVDGTTAVLYGACGTLKGEPRCTRRYHVWLELRWVRHGVEYQVQSHDESRAANVAFARNLHKVAR
jgi:hypothetical protein